MIEIIAAFIFLSIIVVLQNLTITKLRRVIMSMGSDRLNTSIQGLKNEVDADIAAVQSLPNQEEAFNVAAEAVDAETLRLKTLREGLGA